jgi:hypothetical protein
MKQLVERCLLLLGGVVVALAFARSTTPRVEAQVGGQYKAVMFDPKNYVDQSERIAEVCNSEARGGWQFVSLGTVVTTTYLVFRR